MTLFAFFALFILMTFSISLAAKPSSIQAVAVKHKERRNPHS